MAFRFPAQRDGIGLRVLGEVPVRYRPEVMSPEELGIEIVGSFDEREELGVVLAEVLQSRRELQVGVIAGRL